MKQSKNTCVFQAIIYLLFLTLPIFALENAEELTEVPPFDSRIWLSGDFKPTERTPLTFKEPRQIPVFVVHTSLFVPYDRMLEMDKRWRSSYAVFIVLSPWRNIQPQIDEMYPQNTFNRCFHSGWLWNDFSGIGLPRNLDRYNRVFNGLNW